MLNDNDCGMNQITVSGLQEGTYQLILKREGICVPITVYKGDYWKECEDFIIKRRTMIETIQNEKEALKVNKVAISKAEEGHKVDVQLGGDSEGARLHLYGFNFFPKNLFDDLIDPLHFSVSKQVTMFQGARWKNFFMSNRQLSDENRYVMERQYQEK